jgi:AbrB family looped-hinge helix DNA binding protein
MSVLTVTAKGQITLKKDVLRHLGVNPGDRVDVELMPDGRLLMEAAGPHGDIRALRGLYKDRVTRPVSVEEMNQTIADGWAGSL